MKRTKRATETTSLCDDVMRRHYAMTSAPMRDRKRGTVTATKPEALRIAAVGQGESTVPGGNRKSRGPPARNADRELVLPTQIRDEELDKSVGTRGINSQNVMFYCCF